MVDLAGEVRGGNSVRPLLPAETSSPIRVPPLRSGGGHPPPSGRSFPASGAEENGVQAPEIPPETMHREMAYDGGGMSGKLENFIERG